MDRGEQRHSTAAPVEIHQREIQFAASLTDNLQRVSDGSGHENDRPNPEERFANQLIEVTIAREKKNQSWLHWISPDDGTQSVVVPSELEVDTAMGAHFHCSPISAPKNLWAFHG
jgi:hypothetical protein